MAMNPNDPSTYPMRSAKLPSGLTMNFCDAKPAGPPKDTILFVHGFPEFWFEWRYQIPYFVNLGYRTIAVNTRGYNPGEPHPREADAELRESYYSYGKAANDLKELLDHEGIKSCIIVGHDWGALLVQRFAVLHPEYFKKLVLVCIPYIPAPDTYVPLEVAAKAAPYLNYQVYFNTDKAEDEMNANKPLFVNTMFRPGRPGAADGLAKITPETGIMALADPDSPTELLSKEEIAHYVAFYESIGGFNGPLNWYRMGKQSHAEFVGKPKEINIKTLFVGAEFDPFSAPMFTVAMKQYIKDLTLKDVKNAGHWVAYEQHEALNKAIGDWLERGE